jgi:hypothetical protein
MKGTQPFGASSSQKLERIWMTCVASFAVVYMGCMMIEIGPKALLDAVRRPVEIAGLIAGTALFSVGLLGAMYFSRPEQ